jgi:hypothetical protein
VEMGDDGETPTGAEAAASTTSHAASTTSRRANKGNSHNDLISTCKQICDVAVKKRYAGVPISLFSYACLLRFRGDNACC